MHVKTTILQGSRAFILVSPGHRKFTIFLSACQHFFFVGGRGLLISWQKIGEEMRGVPARPSMRIRVKGAVALRVGLWKSEEMWGEPLNEARGRPSARRCKHNEMIFLAINLSRSALERMQETHKSSPSVVELFQKTVSFSFLLWKCK